MKVLKSVVFVTLFTLSITSCSSSVEGVSEENKVLSKTPEVKELSYAIGVDMSKGLMRKVPELNLDEYLRGFKAGCRNSASMSEDSARNVIMNYVQNVKPLAAMKEGEEFLEANKSNKDVQITSTGLQYKIIAPGNDVHPASKDTVTVHYTGTKINGEKFDSSLDRGEPTTFPLNGVIKGWTEGLQLIGEGGKAILYIPSELAYGDQAPPQIGNGQVLIFEVELIKVTPAVVNID